MDILWQPESGKCSHCGRKSKMVRRFTYDRRHVIFCFSCWKKAQHGKHEFLVNRDEWKDDIAMAFECEINESHGTTQNNIWH